MNTRMNQTVMLTMLLTSFLTVPAALAAAENSKSAEKQWLHLKGATGSGAGKHIVFVTGKPHASFHVGTCSFMDICGSPTHSGKRPF